MTTEPVTVVVASPRSRPLLRECVRSILPQARARGASVVIARQTDAADVAAEFAGLGVQVTAVDAGAHATVPQLRGAGLAQVGNGGAALTEDHCVASPGWLDELCAHASADVVGGRMGNAQRAKTIDWAAFFAEYGFFTGQVAGGVPLVTAANVFYGPRALRSAAMWAAEGFWEDVVHARLQATGYRVTTAPSAEMRQNLHYEVRAFSYDRFKHGFEYARTRLRENPHRGRWLRVLSTPALPAILSRRIAARVPPSDRAAFVRALPWTLVFLSAWACGELAGYLRGGRLS